jgi:HSP20 family molecular chaperone IbpA
MKHDNKEVKFEFDLPGFDKKDVNVKITKDKAEIIAEKSDEKK